MAGEEDPQALVLDAIASGPVPLHVVISKTGLRSHEVNKAAQDLADKGEALYRGNMIGPPEPSYVPPPTEEYEDESLREPERPQVFDGADPYENASTDAAVRERPTVEGPEVPVERPPLGPEPQDFWVATGWQQVLAADAQAAADQVLGAAENRNNTEALVLPVDSGEIFERAVVTRKKEL